MSLGGRPTFVQPLGQWPEHGPGHPRRLLLVADGGDTAPETLSPGMPVGVPGRPPEAGMVPLEQSPDRFFLWEAHQLTLRWGGTEVRLAMGLRVGDELHWWQCCRLEVVEDTPHCRVIRMAGAIPVRQVTRAHFRQQPYYADPLLHHHNWVYGDIVARLHANGVCEIFARHVNSKFFDDGLDLHDAVPVLALQAVGADPDAAAVSGLSTGELPAFALGGARFDVHAVSPLATREQPGDVQVRDGRLIWQPYLGMELFGGLCPKEATGDPFIHHAEDRLIPRGMARTLRFTVSLNPARAPRVARYVAPAWWYGLCEELSPRPLLPVSNAFDGVLDVEQQWVRACIHRGGFEDGAVPRHASSGGAERPEPGWEGETPGAMFLAAYRTGDAVDYDLAMRAAYVFHDVHIDHAAKLVRMHGQPMPAVALPMARIHACVYAYLETGDPVLLDTAEAVIETSYRLHKNAWPRLSVGRDACFIRGAMLLYRYGGNPHFLQIARDGIRTVCASQFADGSFGDQGGGAGLHGWNSYIIKPWMGLMAVGGLIDYLEMFDDAVAWATVKRFADWLMAERFDVDSGGYGWSYQHGFNGGREFAQVVTSDDVVILPTRKRWHVDYLARVLTFASLRTGDPAYFDAWAESFAANNARLRDDGKLSSGDHRYAQAWQYVPWVQQRLWHAEVGEEGLVLAPCYFGSRTPAAARISTPDGEIAVRWVDEQRWECRDAGSITTGN